MTSHKPEEHKATRRTYKRVGLGRVFSKMAAMFVPRSLKKKETNQSDCSRKSNVFPRNKAQIKKVELIDERAPATRDCLQEKQPINTASTVTSSTPSQTCALDHSNLNEDKSDDEDEVVSYSKNQRWPTPGEPVCVVCGRYGAYIVDQTDNDVCSLECKARHLKDLTRKKAGELLDGRFLGSNQSTARIENNEVISKTDASDDREFKFHYIEHPVISELTVNQVDDIRMNLNIKVKGDKVGKPILEFQHCQLTETLNKNLAHFGYVTPTPIQMQVIPVGLSSRDVLACAQTGSGKTAAFLVPMIQIISSEIGKGDLLHKFEVGCLAGF